MWCESWRRGASAAVVVAMLAAVAACGGDHRPAAESRTKPGSSSPAAGRALTVDTDMPSGASGLVFFTTGASVAVDIGGPGHGSADDRRTASGSSAVIADKTGKLVWTHAAPAGSRINNFRTQSYQGQPVLTWWQGVREQSHGVGVDYIADQHYQVIATLTPGPGLSSDAHEFRLTADGHALITSYAKIQTDLSAVGGPTDGTMFDCIASVVDVASKRVLYQWDALQHVPLTDSYVPFTPGQTYDPFHMNSIALDPSGNLLTSLRGASTVYDVDPRNSTENWQLGGKHSSLTLTPGVQFAYQHDAEMTSPGVLTLFNNDDDPRVPGPAGHPGASSLMWIRIDTVGHSATLLRNQSRPDGLPSAAMGNLQSQPNGDAFGSWGTAPRISEFDPSGHVVFDATVPQGSYRAYLDGWSGAPILPPSLIFSPGEVHARWNGATNVAQWRLLRGELPATLQPVTTTRWAGLETTIPADDTGHDYFQLQALDAAGHVLAQTPPTPSP